MLTPKKKALIKEILSKISIDGVDEYRYYQQAIENCVAQEVPIEELVLSTHIYGPLVSKSKSYCAIQTCMKRVLDRTQKIMDKKVYLSILGVEKVDKITTKRLIVDILNVVYKEV